MLRTPEDWCKIHNVQVLDPDGWRGRYGRPWTDEIDEAEFLDRLQICTQRPLRNVSDASLALGIPQGEANQIADDLHTAAAALSLGSPSEGAAADRLRRLAEKFL